MTTEKFRACDMIFRKGDISDKLFYIAEGKVGIDEYGVELETGGLFGEIGLFSDDRTRTASARCVTDCRLFSLTEQQFKQLHFQNPQFGYFVMRLMARRLIRNVQKLEGA
jgi:CRP/FNR family cyclic AMP-dependent transcriptional regulator